MMAYKTHIKVIDHGEESLPGSLVYVHIQHTHSGDSPFKHFLQKSPPTIRVEAGKQRAQHTKQTILPGLTSNQSNFHI